MAEPTYFKHPDVLVVVIVILFGALVATVGYVFRTIIKKLDTVCETKVDKENCQLFGKVNDRAHEDNDRQHAEIWERIHHHTHDPKSGNVQVT